MRKPECQILAETYCSPIIEMLKGTRLVEKKKKELTEAEKAAQLLKKRDNARENGYQPDALEGIDPEDLEALKEIPL